MTTAAMTEGVLIEETATGDDPSLSVIELILSSGVHKGRLKVFIFIFYILLHLYINSDF